jgi:pilus assembly protein CpaB
MAVTVQLEDPAKVGAFLRPGSRVAVFDTFETTEGQEEAMTRRTTRPLLADVTVLAVGAVPESGEEGAAADTWAAPLVTVAVDQQQAERLVHAARTGQLYFALLGEGTQVRMNSVVTDSGLFEIPDSSSRGTP